MQSEKLQPKFNLKTVSIKDLYREFRGLQDYLLSFYQIESVFDITLHEADYKAVKQIYRDVKDELSLRQR